MESDYACVPQASARYCNPRSRVPCIALFYAGIDEAAIARRRNEVLATREADLPALADAADAVRDCGRVVIVTSEAALAEYHRDATRPVFDVIRPLLRD